MKRNIFKSVIVAAALAFSASSFAGVITDIVEQDSYVTSTGFFGVTPGSYSYQHNLNDNPIPFTLGSAVSANLSINIYDDDDFIGEAAIIQVESLDLDSEGLWGALAGVAAPGWVNDLQIEALVALNADGFLDVAISGFGDFRVGDSILTVTTADVPEPALLVLFGIGLAGLGFARRKQNA